MIDSPLWGQGGPRSFMRHRDQHFTYGQLREAVTAAGEDLGRCGVSAGAVIAITGEYDFLSAAAFLAAVEAGCIVAPLVGAEAKELHDRLEVAGVEWIYRDGRWEERTAAARAGAHPLIEQLRAEGRAGLILFSSGSTGQPKAMLHDWGKLAGRYRRSTEKDLTILAFMGLDHIGGIDIFLRALASSSCLVVPPERSPETICRLIEEARVNVLPATPSFLNLLLLSDAVRGRDFSSLQIIGFGAERMPERVMRRLREVFPAVVFQQKFGTSETNAVRTINKPDDPLWFRIADSAVEWKVVEEELWLKTPSRILGYLNAESDRLAPDGWYRTGDLVEVDGEGYIRVVARREALINVGGEKVVPGEVEAFVREIEGVADCRVFAEPHVLLGQAAAAELVAEAGVEEADLARRVRRLCRQHLATWKVPVKITVVPRIEVSGRFKRKV